MTCAWVCCGTTNAMNSLQYLVLIVSFKANRADWEGNSEKTADWEGSRKQRENSTSDGKQAAAQEAAAHANLLIEFVRR